MTLPTYTVWFRGKPACPCLAEWLPVFEAELKRRGVVVESIDIAQLIGGAEASGGTHALGGAFDIWQHDDVTVWVARQMGADATWARGAPFDPHAHGVLRGCDHNGPARYQIDAVDAGFNGLGTGGRGAPDDGPRPLSGRTWRDGIAWAKELQEDDMADYADQLTRIENKVDRSLEKLKRVNTRLARANDLLRDAAKTDRNIADAVAEIDKAREEANG